MAQAISNTAPKKTVSFKTGISGAFDPRNQTKPAGSQVSGAFAQSTPAVQGTTLKQSSLTSPALQFQTPKAQAAPAPAVSRDTSLGSYKGVAIQPGDVAKQMAMIDAGSTPKTTSAPMAAPKPTKQSTQSTQQAPVKGLFSSVVSSLANPQASKQTEQAIKAYQKAVEDLKKFELSATETKEGIYSSPTSARVMQGRDQATQVANAETRAALQGAIQEQQAGIGFGQTQQSLNQAAMQAAAGLAAPQVTGFGQTSFDPTTGAFGGGSQNLDPQGVATQLADAVRSGRMTYEQAVQSLGYAGGAGQQFLNNALGPGFNAPLSSAQIGGQQNVFGQLPQMESADIAAEGIKNKVVTYLASNPQLNPSDLAAGNLLQQWIQGKQLTDPKYQTLFNYLNEYTNTLAPILGVGGDPTNLKTQIAQSFINAAASGQSIAEVLDNMQQLSRGKIQDIKSGAVGGGVVSSSTTGTGTGSGGLYDW